MRIALVNNNYRLGGAETVARDLLAGCARAGHATRMYVGMGKTYPRGADVLPLYPRALSRLHHSRLRPLVDLFAPRGPWTDRRFRALADGWPDLVHVHSFHGDYATVESLAFVAARKPLVWTFHGHWGITGGCEHPLTCTRYEDACGECPRLGVWPIGAIDDTATQLDRKLRHLGAVVLHVIAPSRFLAARVARSRVGRRWSVHHVPNGVSPDAFGIARKHDPAFRRSLGLDPSATVALVVNRNFRDPQKGYALVRDALAALTRPPAPVQVVLAGSGSDGAVLELSPEIRPMSMGYVDSTARMAALYEASDVFLFASPAETFPCVILEAMASGCCVVATPTSGVTEQVEDGVTGVLATTIDGADLGRALRAVIGDRDRLQALGATARQRVAAEFSLDLMINRHLQIYETVVHAHVATDRHVSPRRRPGDAA